MSNERLGSSDSEFLGVEFRIWGKGAGMSN